MTSLLDTFWSVEILVQLAVPIYLMCRRLPRRPTTTPRLVIASAVLLAVAIVPLATGAVTGLDVKQSFLVFSVLLAVLTGAVMFAYDASPWQALFCTTTGYTLQNLTSGGIILAQFLITGRATQPLGEPLATVVSLAAPALVYGVAYLVLVRGIEKNGLLVAESSLMLVMFVIVVFVIIGFDLVIKGITLGGMKFAYLVMLRVVHALICAFVLFAEYELLYATRLGEEKAETERLLAERERQYRLSRENIEAINIKCHDIRHQIRQLAGSGAVVDGSVIDDIAREVNVYDSVVETGNEALDTILTEKSLACSGEGIVLSVIADGAALDFMAPADIYSLFGNALDNAIEAVRGVGDPERRVITLSVQRRQQMVAVSVENYCAQEPRFSDGLPLTTKRDGVNHGFGMRSMRAIAGRYGGSLHAGLEGGLFYLNVLLARPAEA